MTIGIIGLGLIGGSLAADLKIQLNVRVIGYDANPTHAKEAESLNLVHQMVDLHTLIEVSDLIVLATPVDVIEKMLPTILERVTTKQYLTDVGSTKKNICEAVSNHRNRRQYIAAHPLSGTEFSGPSAAIKGLFNGKKNIICERERSHPNGVEVIEQLFASVGMTTVYMNPEQHDMHLAYVSHLSHVTSFALGLTVLEIEKDEKQIFNLASTGFASTARLAKSNPSTWQCIFSKNKFHLLEALDRYIHTMKSFREAIQKDDQEELMAMMQSANMLEEILTKRTKTELSV